MRHVLENNKLTIYLEGELNSYNSEEVEKEIEEITKNSSFSSIVLDFKDLSYISSAGLRIVIRLKQLYDDTSIINAQKVVFDIFKMVGLTNAINIKQA